MHKTSYVDYEYYRNYNPQMNEIEFKKYAGRASQELARLILNRVTFDDVDLSIFCNRIKICVCELINHLKTTEDNNQKALVTSESVGPHSISINTKILEKTSKQINSEKMDIVNLYLFDTGLLYKGLHHDY